MTEITEEMVKAAHEAYAKTTGGLLAGHPMRNALSALDAAGFAVVPKEPTDEMLQAGFDNCVNDWPDAECRTELPRIYRAMLSAAQVKP